VKEITIQVFHNAAGNHKCSSFYVLSYAYSGNLLPVRERGCSTVVLLSLLIRATSCDVADPMDARDDLDSERRKDKAACSCRDWAMLWQTEHK